MTHALPSATSRGYETLEPSSVSQLNSDLGKYGIEKKLCVSKQVNKEAKLCGWRAGCNHGETGSPDYRQAESVPRRLKTLSYRSERCHGIAKQETGKGQKKEEESQLAIKDVRGRMGQVEDLESEVAALRTDLLQVKEQLAKKEFKLVNKER